MRNSRWYPRSEGSQRDSQVSKKKFDDNWDQIFGKKDKVEEAVDSSDDEQAEETEKD